MAKCPNNRCLVPTGQIKMGPVAYASWWFRDVKVTGFEMGKTEVTVGEYRAYLRATSTQIQLQAILSGCKAGEPTRKLMADTETPAETEEQFRSRAAQTFVSGKCASMTLVTETTSKSLPQMEDNYLGDNHPVNGLAWSEMRAYCQHQGGDLPTAAQYERAAKGPSGKDLHGTPFDKAIITRQVEDGYTRPDVAPVCGPNDERANGFGICDLAGNLEEATRDAFEYDFYEKKMPETDVDHPVVDPINPVTDPMKQEIEVRGGSRMSLSQSATASNRSYSDKLGNDTQSQHNRRLGMTGFRCVWPELKK